jgi:broad specificity phosphatase PhoE
MTRFWWVRHGPTHARGMVGWTDLPADLSDAPRLARLAAALPAAAVVVSSDLARAVATADALVGARPRLPHDPALREIHFGAWEMRTHAEIAAEDPETARAFWDSPGAVRPPGGESWADLAARVTGAVGRLAAAHPGGEVIVVAHFGAILAALAQALALAPPAVFGHRIAPLTLTEIALGPGTRGNGPARVGRIGAEP